MTAWAADALPEPVFTTEARVEQSVPYLTVGWEIPEEEEFENSVRFELQSAGSADFADAVVRYLGPDQASFISGLAEGDYFFRVRSVSETENVSAWSNPVHVTIEYDSLAKAFLLFGIGAVVSIATVALVVTGDRRARREDSIQP